jgi:hypothetical protein
MYISMQFNVRLTRYEIKSGMLVPNSERLAGMEF